MPAALLAALVWAAALGLPAWGPAGAPFPGWAAPALADDDGAGGGDDDDDAPVAAVEVRGGERILTLPEGAAEASGFLAAPVRGAEWRERTTVLGAVLDAAPLLEDSAALAAAAVRLRHARGRVPALRARLARAEELHRGPGSVPLAEVEAAREALREGEAGRDAAEVVHARIERRLAHRWGPALAGRAPGLLARLAGREAVLVQAPRPAGPAWEGAAAEALAGGAALPLEPLGDGFAEVHGMAAGAGLFLAPGAGLRPGLRVEVRFTGGGPPERGARLPAGAVVFHDGRAWAYLALGESRFVRRGLEGLRRMGRGWFAPALRPGERVVVRGAQMLLAEEFRARIMREDDD